jgi:hypothetical protein
MSDITDLLNLIAPDVPAPDAGVVDADLARGRAALLRARRRRTVRRAGTASVSLAAVGAIGVVLAQPSATTHRVPRSSMAITTRPSTATAAHDTGRPSIELVAYTGAQLAGFTVSEVPDGWHLSTSTPDALLITREGSTNNDPNDFVDKLAVLTSSVDQHGLGSGDAVSVDGQPGRVAHEPGTLLLSYNTPNGFGVNIQAPTALGWSDADIVTFAAGVQVTDHAVHSAG